jgi:hypothetical protein
MSVFTPLEDLSLGGLATYQANKQHRSSKNQDAKASNIKTENLILPIRKHRVGFIDKLPIIKKPAFNETEKLENIVDKSHHILLSASTVFPFVIFADTIQIDRQKLTITHRNSFRSARTSSVSLNDIQNIEGNVGPIFGSLIITSKFFQKNTQSINFLKRKDVIEIQQLMQGYMVAIHGGIDITTIPTEKLIILLNDLGRSVQRKH